MPWTHVWNGCVIKHLSTTHETEFSETGPAATFVPQWKRTLWGDVHRASDRGSPKTGP